ncbi:MAG: dCMP deaminase family protein [Planctomycetota bacterium]|nr:dCMP deaminase family protein [Planctomycetota bacterium]
MRHGHSTRPSWDEYFMAMARLTARRSTCVRRAVGAVLVKDHHLLASGYNGAPKGLKHCSELGECLRERLRVPSGERHEICRGVHAEQNAIVQAAVFGGPIAGACLYTTTFPCVICAKLLLNAGIRRIVFETDYEDPLAKKILREGKVKLVPLRRPARGR